MAEKRMISKKVVNTDTFMKMPITAQALYFHLAVNADDEGFVGNHRCIRESIGATESDLDVLVDKNYLISFDEGVIVIRHWRVHNTLRRDRFSPTIFVANQAKLRIDKSGAYYLNGDPTVATQYRLDKDSIDNDSIVERGEEPLATDEVCLSSSGFMKPTIGEIEAYIHEKDYTISASKFYDFYESKGWRVGSSPMKNWKAAIRTWAAREKPAPSSTTPSVDADKYKRED